MDANGMSTAQILRDLLGDLVRASLGIRQSPSARKSSESSWQVLQPPMFTRG